MERLDLLDDVVLASLQRIDVFFPKAGDGFLQSPSCPFGIQSTAPEVCRRGTEEHEPLPDFPEDGRSE